MKLSELQAIGELCEKKATPYRIPDYEQIWSKVEGDPVIRVKFLFEETFNTGYDGVLHRWLIEVDGKNGEKVNFLIDLFPSA